MLEVPIWRAGREHHSLDIRTLLSYRGEPLARVHQAPSLLVHRTLQALRAAAPGPAEDPALRWAAIARAGDLLAAGDFGLGDPDEHARAVTLATGAPISDTRRAMGELAAGLKGIDEALRWQAPGGDLEVFRTHRLKLGEDRTCAWAPVGQVMGFIAPSNHPGVHLTWIMALAMGYTVAVRPGADDPLTPWRLIRALVAAGFPTERVALLPGGHDLVPAIIEGCDRTVAYGGPALGQVIGRDDRVLFNGPGRSKVFVDGPVPLEPAVDFLLESILHDGGRKCTCASGILVREPSSGAIAGPQSGAGPRDRGDLLEAVAQRLAALPLLDPLDPAARVPAWKDRAAAEASPAGLAEVDGIAFARPGLLRCADPTCSPYGIEIPAPFTTAATLPPEADPLPFLRGSLAVTLLTRDRKLHQRCLLEPSIRKVFRGPVPPWQTEPGAPHQGRLSDFLHTCKYAPEVKASWI